MRNEMTMVRAAQALGLMRQERPYLPSALAPIANRQAGDSHNDALDRLRALLRAQRPVYPMLRAQLFEARAEARDRIVEIRKELPAALKVADATRQEMYDSDTLAAEEAFSRASQIVGSMLRACAEAAEAMAWIDRQLAGKA